VSALKGTSALMGVLAGILLLGERTNGKSRIAGGVLITTGAVMIGVLG
jgi:uncharacterized membrane protein